MALVRVFSPVNQTEVAVATALLEAHGVPVFVHNQNVGSLMPGLQVNALNTQSVMVPEEFASDAAELLSELNSDQSRISSDPLPWRDRLRVVLEGFLFGWLVPGRRGRGGSDSREDHDA